MISPLWHTEKKNELQTGTQQPTSPLQSQPGLEHTSIYARCGTQGTLSSLCVCGVHRLSVADDGQQGRESMRGTQNRP